MGTYPIEPFLSFKFFNFISGLIKQQTARGRGGRGAPPPQEKKNRLAKALLYHKPLWDGDGGEEISPNSSEPVKCVN